MRKKLKQEYDTTSNNSVYNKAKKRVYEQQSKIKCSFCPYHDGENWGDKKVYGPIWRRNREKRPSWKLKFKDKKPWVKSKKRPFPSIWYDGETWKWV